MCAARDDWSILVARFDAHLYFSAFMIVSSRFIVLPHSSPDVVVLADFPLLVTVVVE